jgi:lipoprotein-releasing system permease protein
MPVELFIALRYLSASRKRAHVALVSAISVAGLALGVAALVVSIALLTGFQDKIRTRLAANTPHLVVEPSSSETFSDASAVARAVSADRDVRRVDPAFEGRGWVADARSRTILPARYRAGAGAPKAGETEVSTAVAGQLGVARGSLVVVASLRTVLTPLGPIPVTVPLHVSSLRRAGTLEATPDLAISREDAAVLAGAPDPVSKLEVRLADPSRADAVARRLRGSLGGAVLVRTARQLNSGLDFALRLEKVLIFVTVFLIVLVAALNVVSDLALLVVEKRRDLGVLATLGASPRALSRVYWWLGGSISGIGTVAGVAIGAALSWALDRFSLVRLPPDVYVLDHVPFALHPRDLALVLLFSAAAALAATAMPARSAARVGPAEALRLSR